MTRLPARGLTVWVVLGKELVDAWRDRRTLWAAALLAVVLGPAVQWVMLGQVGDLLRQAESRALWVQGLEQAPTLRNHLERQSWQPRVAPPDLVQRLNDGRFSEPVLVVPPDFEAQLAAARQPVLEIVYRSGPTRTMGGVARLEQAVQGFNAERATLALAMRAVAPALLQAVAVQQRDLAAPSARWGRLTGLVPMFLLLAVLYVTLAAAADSTAGERERGTLQSLLLTPGAPLALALGKWAAVWVAGAITAALSLASFQLAQNGPGQQTVSALLQFGAREAAWLWLLIAPLTALLSACMMAIGMRCRTHKEAQTQNSFLMMLVSFLPMLEMLDLLSPGSAALQLPVLAQSLQMNRVLRGEPPDTDAMLIAAAVCLVLTLPALAAFSRAMRRAALD